MEGEPMPFPVVRTNEDAVKTEGDRGMKMSEKRCHTCGKLITRYNCSIFNKWGISFSVHKGLGLISLLIFVK